MLYIFCWFQRSVQRHTINTNIRIQMQSFVQTCLNYLYEYWFLWLSMPTNIHNTSQWKVWAYKFSILNRQVFFSPPFLFTHTICNFIFLIVSRNLHEQCTWKLWWWFAIFSTFHTPQFNQYNGSGYGAKRKRKKKTQNCLNWQKSVKSTKNLSWILLYLARVRTRSNH